MERAPEKPCTDCGKPTILRGWRGPKSKRCFDCQRVANRDSMRRSRKKRRALGVDPEKDSARRITREALERGVLRRAERCAHCRRRDDRTAWWRLQAHHPDYAQPFNVVWLCVRCHSAEHARVGRAPRRTFKEVS